MLFILGIVVVVGWICREDIAIGIGFFKKPKKLFCRACGDDITYALDSEPLGHGAKACYRCHISIEERLKEMLPEWYTGPCPTEEPAPEPVKAAPPKPALPPQVTYGWKCLMCGAPPNEDCKCEPIFRNSQLAHCERCGRNRLDVDPMTLYCWSCRHEDLVGPGTSVEIHYLQNGREVTVVKNNCTKCGVRLIEAEKIKSGLCLTCSSMNIDYPLAAPATRPEPADATEWADRFLKDPEPEPPSAARLALDSWIERTAERRF